MARAMPGHARAETLGAVPGEVLATVHHRAWTLEPGRAALPPPRPLETLYGPGPPPPPPPPWQNHLQGPGRADKGAFEAKRQQTRADPSPHPPKPVPTVARVSQGGLSEGSPPRVTGGPQEGTRLSA